MFFPLFQFFTISLFPSLFILSKVFLYRTLPDFIFIGFSSLLLLPRQTLSRIKPEQHLPSVSTQVAVPAPGCPGGRFGYVGAGGLWRELGWLFLLPCPGKVNKGSLRLQTSSPGNSANPSSDSPVPLPSDGVFLPSLCFKPAIQSNYLLSALLTAVFYRLADCCRVSSKSLLSLGPDTVFSRVKCFRSNSSRLLHPIFLFGLQAVALFVHLGTVCAFVRIAGS